MILKSLEAVFLSEIFKRKFFIEEELSEANNQKEY
jgi:hypothetical protein